MANEYPSWSNLDILHATIIDAYYAKAISSSTPTTYRKLHAEQVLAVYRLLPADMRFRYTHMIEPTNAFVASLSSVETGTPSRAQRQTISSPRQDTSQPYTAGPLSSATKTADDMQKTDKSIVTAPAKRKPRKSGYKRRLFTKEEDFRLAELVERESDEKTIQEAFPDRGRATLVTHRRTSTFLSRQAEMRKQLEEERRGSQMLEDGDGEDRDQLLEEENLSPV
ncbi:hypothetical protein LTR97_008252 [Elasticomyces elasticus]|uniref:Myb-like domain-containing protein n=1 Tax=Elasticomyces elasticus TaxID=574655 RepID=A0AAN7W360_9PEZI|nr:hypothetical protein LTR97_008252 [Elasticomyces elasticus]